jgi:type III secretory pathway component EscR
MTTVVKFNNGYTINSAQREYLRVHNENNTLEFFVNNEQQYWEAVRTIVDQYGFVPYYEVVKL